jgi:hypothetical protein
MYIVNRHGFNGKWAFLKSSLDVANQTEKERARERERERDVGHFEYNNVFAPGAVKSCGQGREKKKRVERTVSASGIFITSFQISIQCGLIASPRSPESFYASVARIIFNIIFNPTPIVPRDTCFKCAHKKRRENSYDCNYSRKLALAA